MYADGDDQEKETSMMLKRKLLPKGMCRKQEGEDAKYINTQVKQLHT